METFTALTNTEYTAQESELRLSSTFDDELTTTTSTTTEGRSLSCSPYLNYVNPLVTNAGREGAEEDHSISPSSFACTPRYGLFLPPMVADNPAPFPPSSSLSSIDESEEYPSLMTSTMTENYDVETQPVSPVIHTNWGLYHRQNREICQKNAARKYFG